MRHYPPNYDDGRGSAGMLGCFLILMTFFVGVLVGALAL